MDLLSPEELFPLSAGPGEMVAVSGGPSRTKPTVSADSESHECRGIVARRHICLEG